MCIGDAIRCRSCSRPRRWAGSWRYYSHQVEHGACEYFLGVGEAPGRWPGSGLEPLGQPGAQSEGVAARGDLRPCDAPDRRSRLGRAWRADGVTGYDLCFSAPKSVSALWALGGPGWRRSSEGACGSGSRRAGLSRHPCRVLTGWPQRHTQVATDGLAAAVFDHRTSRAGDPQLHTHALVLNKLQCPDGEWRTVDGHEIYAHKKSAGMIYQAALRSELTRRLGIAWEPVSRDGQAEIAGIPTQLVKRWSTRAQQVATDAAPVIAAYEAELGRPLTSAERTAVAKVAVIKTRPARSMSTRRLLDRWQSRGGRVGLGSAPAGSAVGRGRRRHRADPPARRGPWSETLSTRSGPRAHGERSSPAPTSRPRSRPGCRPAGSTPTWFGPSWRSSPTKH